VGPVTALTLAIEIDPAAFESGRHLAACAGLAPKEHSTGGKQRMGGIRRAGNERLRVLLVTGATSVIRAAMKPGSQQMTDWLRAMLLRKPPQVVTVALANEMARVPWALMTRGEVYRRSAATGGVVPRPFIGGTTAQVRPQLDNEMAPTGTGARWRASRPTGTSRWTLEPRVDGGVKEQNEMTIGRTDDPENPVGAQAFEAASMFVGVDGPRRHRVCQIEVVVVDLRQRRPSVEQISRIGMDTSKHVFQLHGVNAAEAVVLRKKLRRKEMVAFFEKLHQR
jgi:Transposase IS116/IS110/IS902 family